MIKKILKKIWGKIKEYFRRFSKKKYERKVVVDSKKKNNRVDESLFKEMINASVIKNKQDINFPENSEIDIDKLNLHLKAKELMKTNSRLKYEEAILKIIKQ